MALVWLNLTKVGFEASSGSACLSGAVSSAGMRTRLTQWIQAATLGGDDFPLVSASC